MERTVMQVLDEAVNRFGDSPAYKVLGEGGWRETSYRECREEVLRVARGFISLGVAPGTGVAILGSNRPEWFIADLAAIHAGGFPAGIYVTASPEQCSYVIHHSEAAVAVVEDIPALGKILGRAGSMPLLKTIVLLERQPEPLPAGEALPRVISWQELLRLGDDSPPGALSERVATQRPEDCCTLIYTSGTTGPPKAVMISHASFTWLVERLLKEIGGVPFGPEDQMVSYLPLSHVAEQVVSVHAPMQFGGCVWFVGDLERLGETLREARPAIFFAVPRVWEKIQARIVAAARENPSRVRSAIARWARGVGLAGGYAEQRGERRPLGWPLADALVFRKVRRRLGLDRCRLAVTSAAPIAISTLEFYLSLGLPLCEVYGMSEATGPTTLSLPSRYRTGKAGFAIPGTELRIEPDGEILIRGPHLFLGYFKDEEATREAMTEDGWLRSGDVGFLDEDGFLQITDRKKELFVTAGGKNVAPQVLEALLKSIPVVMQAVAIGDGKKYLSALLVLDPEQLPLALAEAGLQGEVERVTRDPLAALGLPAFRELLQRQIDGVNERVSRVEQIKRWTLLPGELTVEGGELTPTLKLKRRVIQQKYGLEIDRLYE
ncbi:MAG: AMP-binding protein [Polyangia bacterium]|jgi:long-subunit acyl-CoA synthetase (AMP-forming)|nr:AMP-binding protein [Polyangia bacterium]